MRVRVSPSRQLNVNLSRIDLLFEILSYIYQVNQYYYD